MSLLSRRQIEANRNNALYSTGPKTAEGKATVSQNGVKHGFYSRQILIAGEDAGQFETLHRGLVEANQPVGLEEERLVLQIAIDWWKLARTDRMENALYNHCRERLKDDEEVADPSRQDIVRYASWHHWECVRDLLNFDGRFELSASRAWRDLLALQRERRALRATF